MQRFFVTFPLGIDVVITDIDMVNQITKVLRMREGESIVLFDGDESETEYVLEKIEKKSLRLRGKWRCFPESEPKKKVFLYQALPNKHEKIEFIIQKWVEIGIRKFVFFRSDRSQKLILSESKKERFVTIAKEALEQCGGLVMPEILFLDTFPEPDTHISHIVLDTVGKSSAISEFRDLQDVGVWIGPEWGWSDTERAKMSQYDFIFAHFWKRVLRTETAWIVVSFSLLNQ